MTITNKVQTIYIGVLGNGITGISECEGCKKLRPDDEVLCNDLCICNECKKLGIYVACCSCDAMLNAEDGLAISWAPDGYKCDACNDYANQPFEMDWQGHD
jgi:hypothetical protein